MSENENTDRRPSNRRPSNLTENLVVLEGYFGGDSYRYSDGETSRVNFDLGTQKNIRDQETGEWISRTQWHHVVAFRWNADLVKRAVEGGDKFMIRVRGRLSERRYRSTQLPDREDGKPNYVYVTEVIADSIRFIGRVNLAEVDAPETDSDSEPKTDDETAESF